MVAAGVDGDVDNDVVGVVTVDGVVRTPVTGGGVSPPPSGGAVVNAGGCVVGDVVGDVARTVEEVDADDGGAVEEP